VYAVLGCIRLAIQLRQQSSTSTDWTVCNGDVVVSGVSADGQDTWTGVFVSQFTEPFQNVLAALAQTGSVTNTYSATITVSSATTSLPEPGTIALLFAALASWAVFLDRSSRHRQFR